MAATFVLGPVKEDGTASLFVRVQDFNHKIQIKQKTGLYIEPLIWERRNDHKFMLRYKTNTDVNSIIKKADKIREDINSRFERGIMLNKDAVREIVHNVVYAEQIQEDEEKAEAERLAIELANRMTFRKFFDKYIIDAQAGKRLSEKGTVYAKGTFSSLCQAHDHLRDFETQIGREYDFDDINMEFYLDYTAYLNGRGLALNTIGKNINWLKTMMSIAESEGYHTNRVYRDKRFKGARVEVDTIYLTKQDLNKLRKVDLSNRTPGFELARDIFFIGVWTAQRVSDYNNISKDDIKTIKRRIIVDKPDPKHKGKTIPVVEEEERLVLNLRQKKTGAKVAIPCSPELKRILEKYEYNIPRLSDQNINDNIKEVAKMAKLTEKIKITTIKGGKEEVNYFPKWKLVHTHTARRTGATLMYLSGMDIYDIMKITGHTTPVTLKKYIKADELEVADKILDKYDYFK